MVVRGSGRMKLDDEIVELEEWDAVRVPPGTWRGYEAGPEGLEILVIGSRPASATPAGRTSRAGAVGGRRSAAASRRRWWSRGARDARQAVLGTAALSRDA